MEHLEELKQVDQLRDPVLISGFMMRRRAGRLAARTVGYLAEQWDAEPIAKIDMSPFINLSIYRPQISRNGEDASLQWPEATIYLARTPARDCDLVLLPAAEPDFYWQTFVKTLAEYFDGLGVKTLVSLRAQLGEVPHTRPAPVYVTATDIDLELQFGVQSARNRNEGPSSIGGILATHVQSMRWRTAELAVIQPDYFPRMPNAEAMLSLVRLVDKAFGTSTPMASLNETASRQREMLDRGAVGDHETQQIILEREQSYDAALEKMDFLAPIQAGVDLPSGEEAIQEIEELLRGDHPED